MMSDWMAKWEYGYFDRDNTDARLGSNVKPVKSAAGNLAAFDPGFERVLTVCYCKDSFVASAESADTKR